MAKREDVERVLASCENCESVYAARQWPNDDIQIIGKDGCSCGASTFEIIEETDVLDDPDEFDATAGTGAE
ncbi:hypothetical protein [Halostagnicola bangensis]